MKNLISYVIQNEKGHRHFSEVLNIESPPYTYNSNPSISNVMEWADKKKAKLKDDDELVIVNVFKL